VAERRDHVNALTQLRNFLKADRSHVNVVQAASEDVSDEYFTSRQITDLTESFVITMGIGTMAEQGTGLVIHFNVC